jgi:hypothetical protein
MLLVGHLLRSCGGMESTGLRWDAEAEGGILPIRDNSPAVVREEAIQDKPLGIAGANLASPSVSEARENNN